jgi:hypothetical protein
MIRCRLSSLLENPKCKLPIAPKFSRKSLIGFFDSLHTFETYKTLTVEHFPMRKVPFTRIHHGRHIININDDSDANDSDGDSSDEHNSKGMNYNTAQSSIY